MRSWSVLFPHLGGLKAFLGGNGKSMVPRDMGEWFTPPFVDPGEGALKELFKRSLTPEKIDRIYFGVEFCQRLIPRDDELREAVHISRDAGLAFSFVTPPVTDAGIESLQSRFALLQEESGADGETEVIVNDWGGLVVLKSRYDRLTPVMGRMMNKMIRDPRVSPYYVSDSAPPEGLRVVQQSSVTNPLYHKTLKDWGVYRHEFDNLFQGVRLENEDPELLFSVYLPYGYVATGRICMPGSFNLPKADKFTEYMDCRKECRSFTHKLANPQWSFSNRSVDLIQRGNTLFYPNTRSMLEEVLVGGTSEILDRIVYQPELPI
jgi:hypothetical protein